MEEQSGVYVFDEADKENCFEISQFKNNNKEEYHGGVSGENESTGTKNIFEKEKAQCKQTNNQKIFEDEEQIELSSDESEEMDSDKDDNVGDSSRKQYIAAKNIEKIKEYHRKSSKNSFYELSKISVEGKQKQVLNVTNINEFILSPIHPNIVLECTMIKVNRGLLSHSWEVYSQNKFLMSAQKLLSHITKYKVFSNKEMAESHYIGKIQSNFLGTQWFAFDNGVNPDRSRDLEGVRKMLGSVNYQFNLLGKKGPRKMEVYLPSVTADSMKPFSCLQNINLLKFLYEKRPAIISRFVNKQPEYDEKQDCYKLNFNGKVKTASVKNFILIDEQTQKQALLFGKTAQDLYFFEARYPFSPLQALALCISSVDRKLGVE